MFSHATGFGSVVVLLFGVIAYFLKRLVDQLDNNTLLTSHVISEMKLMDASINKLKNDIMDLISLRRDFDALKLEYNLYVQAQKGRMTPRQNKS